MKLTSLFIALFIVFCSCNNQENTNSFKKTKIRIEKNEIVLGDSLFLGLRTGMTEKMVVDYLKKNTKIKCYQSYINYSKTEEYKYVFHLNSETIEFNIFFDYDKDGSLASINLKTTNLEPQMVNAILEQYKKRYKFQSFTNKSKSIFYYNENSDNWKAHNQRFKNGNLSNCVNSLFDDNYKPMTTKCKICKIYLSIEHKIVKNEEVSREIIFTNYFYNENERIILEGSKSENHIYQQIPTLEDNQFLKSNYERQLLFNNRVSITYYNKNEFESALLNLLKIKNRDKNKALEEKRAKELMKKELMKKESETLNDL